GDEDIMELLWQNGQVVMQSQNQKPNGNNNNKRVETQQPSTTTNVIDDETTPCNLYMQEDEMVSWLHYPSDDNNNLDLYLHNNDILYPVLPATANSLQGVPPVISAISVPPPRASIVFPRVVEEHNQNKFGNFSHFSKPNFVKNTTTGSAPTSSNKMSEVTTVVESNNQPIDVNKLRGGMMTSSSGREVEAYDVSASTSSPGTGGSGSGSGSGASPSAEPIAKKSPPVGEDRKRKGRDVAYETECYSENQAGTPPVKSTPSSSKDNRDPGHLSTG
nr:transcription factor PIF1-like [Tanacetum cinerariifolium]